MADVNSLARVIAASMVTFPRNNFNAGSLIHVRSPSCIMKRDGDISYQTV